MTLNVSKLLKILRKNPTYGLGYNDPNKMFRAGENIEASKS